MAIPRLLGTVFQAYGDVCEELGEIVNARTSRLVSGLPAQPETVLQ